VTVKSLVNELLGADVSALSNKSAGGLPETLEKAQSEVKTALSDSFDTPRAMRAISELIKEANIHINTHKSDIDVRGLESIGRWITKMVGIFGLDANASPPYEGLGWASSAANSHLTPKEIVAPYATIYESVRSSVQSLNIHSEVLDKLLVVDVDAEFASLKSSNPEELAMPYLRAVSRTRDELRKVAPTSPSKKEILSLSDKIRDVDLTNLGVYLDDRPDDQPSLIKFVPASELLAQREEKLAKERERIAGKEKARLERERIEKEKEQKAMVSHLEMFKGDEKWSAWDEDGLPTKTKDGEDVPKSAAKKLRKEWERQKKVHEEWKAKHGGSST
jgi:cysteinyl-tRNA synthetase